MINNLSFSFILPAFKSAFLREAINSILNQTYSEFELIIVDDASPEDLDSIIRSFSDNRLKYYRNEKNIGGFDLVTQWNKCLSFAKNEYVILASDDDLYDKYFLQSMVLKIDKYPKVNVFHSRVQTINSNGIIVDYSSACAELESCQEFIWHRICKGRAQYIPEFIFKRQALLESGGFVNFPSAWGSDHATAFLLAKDNGVVCCNSPLFKWRYSGLNISSAGNYTNNKVDGLFQYYRWIKEFVSKLDDSFYRGLIETGLEKYLFKRLASLLSHHTFLLLFAKLINPFIKDKRIRKKHLIIALGLKIKNSVSLF